MSQKAQLLQVIEQDLQDDLQAFAQLTQQMSTLYARLMARDCPNIEVSNQHIGQLLDAVALRARRRAKVLQALRLDARGGAMERLFALLAPTRSATLCASWQALTGQARRCRELNERNGRLLGMHGDILQQLLNQRPDAIYQPSV